MIFVPSNHSFLLTLELKTMTCVTTLLVDIEPQPDRNQVPA